jgi:hypothetical protein
VEAYLMLLWCVVCEVSWWMSVRGRGRAGCYDKKSGPDWKEDPAIEGEGHFGPNISWADLRTRTTPHCPAQRRLSLVIDGQRLCIRHTACSDMSAVQDECLVPDEPQSCILYTWTSQTATFALPLIGPKQLRRAIYAFSPKYRP